MPQNNGVILKRLVECLYRSEYKFFETTTHSIQSVTNEAIVEIIPKSLPHIRYIETLKMNFNKLSYDCGGILSLWFGLSPLSLEFLEFFKEKLPLIKFCLKSIVTNLIKAMFLKNRKRDFTLLWKWTFNEE